MQSDIAESQVSISSNLKKPKTKQQYSRNVKKLKVKYTLVSQQIQTLQTKVSRLSNTSNDKVIALKIAKFCKQRNFTPQMIFRFADKGQRGAISKNVFRQTINKIGLKLSQHELTRIQYLIDEDLSGIITQLQFCAYLSAFGIRKQFTGDDPLIKNALGKLDLEKIRLIAEQNKKNQGKNKRKNLINYQQFLKYCHKHLPHLSNKQLAGIFNRLQRNGLVDLDQLIQYLKNRQREDAKLREMNKQNIDKNKKDQEKKIVKEQDDITTLKGKIRILLKNRPQDTKSLFHSSQFQRVQKIYKQKKGSWLAWFRRIDRKKKGSFGYNQLIMDYIDYEKKNSNLIFCYQLMGRKIVSSGDKPQNIIAQYNKNHTQITRSQFEKFGQMEFQFRKLDLQKLWNIILQGKNQNKIEVQAIIQAMNLRSDAKRIVFIKPNLWNTHPSDFLQQGKSTMLLNPFVALRNCILILNQYSSKQGQLWHDYQFGPTFSDPSGQNSISMDIPFSYQELQWIRTLQLGMGEFFFQSKQYKFNSTSLCTHDILPKTLITLLQNKKDLLWNKNPVNYVAKNKILQQDLIPLFHGMYPQVFKSFAKIGLYVFKFFVRQRWVYVMVDNKIPCNSSGQPLFSVSQGKKHSWISLIQKAYAKVHGGYGKLFKYSKTCPKFIYQFSRKVPIQLDLPRNLKVPQQKNNYWQFLKQKCNQMSQQVNTFALTSQQFQSCLVLNNIQTGFIKNKMNKIHNAIQIVDQKCKNAHKSHRLLILQKKNVKNITKWNSSWCEQLDNNKYDSFYSQIQNILKNNKSKLILDKNQQVFVTNYKNFRQIFSTFINPTDFNYQNNVILRKRLQLQWNFVCKYHIKSKNKKGRVVFSLNHIRGSSPTLLLIQLKSEDNKILQKFEMKDYYSAFQISLNNKEFKILQISIKSSQTTSKLSTGNLQQQLQDNHYSLTFYFDNDKYELKQRDRQILFEKVNKISQEWNLDFDNATGAQRNFILMNYYKNAQRGGCCGCFG